MNIMLEFIRPKSRFGSNMYKGARTGSKDSLEKFKLIYTTNIRFNNWIHSLKFFFE